MNDDRVHARLLEIDDVLGEGVGKRLIAHGVSAKLDHHRLLVVTEHVRQRFRQDVRLHMCRDILRNDRVLSEVRRVFCFRHVVSRAPNFALPFRYLPPAVRNLPPC